MMRLLLRWLLRRTEKKRRPTAAKIALALAAITKNDANRERERADKHDLEAARLTLLATQLGAERETKTGRDVNTPRRSKATAYNTSSTTEDTPIGANAAATAQKETVSTSPSARRANN